VTSGVTVLQRRAELSFRSVKLRGLDEDGKQLTHANASGVVRIDVGSGSCAVIAAPRGAEHLRTARFPSE
jgi:hypothetical protein